MVKYAFAVAIALVAGLAAAGAVRADERYYVWTYEYSTLAGGNTEVEFYQTAVTRDVRVSNRSDWQQQVELEYGITDHLDTGIYEMYEQPADGAFSYAGYKFKLRYRLAERDALPVDVLLYGEQVQPATGDSSFEGKAVFAKEIGRCNVAYNQIYEYVYRTGKGEHEYAAGVSYEVSPSFRLGAESKGSYSESKYAAGPTVAWIGGRIWANFGAVFALNNRTNDREVRFLLGVPF